MKDCQRRAAGAAPRRARLIGFVLCLLSPLVIAATAGGSAPAQSVVHTTDPQDLRLIHDLESVLPVLIRAYETPGLNIALARRGRLAWEGAYGYADAKARRAMTPETVFHSGSIAKGYAAVSIMQLVEKGVLGLDDPINRHLPFEVRNPLGGPAITIRHLLTHTSGLGGDIASSFLCGGTEPVRSLAEVVQSSYLFQIQQAPTGLKYLHPMWTQPAGAKFQYSNLGVATLGLIVERANPEHLSYSDYVQKHIMDLLAMKYAQIPPAQNRQFIRPDIWARMSTGYQTMGGAWIPTAQVCFGEFPCGGSLATPRDFLRLMTALMGGGQLDGARLLTPQSVATMLTPAQGFENSRADQQGLIWRLGNWSSDSPTFQHGGGHMFGWLTTAIAYPRAGTAFVAAVNHWSAPTRDSHQTLLQLQEFIAGWLKQEAAGPDPKFTPDWIERLRARSIPPAPTVEKAAWKTSYLRGLLFAESYQFSIGTPQRLTEAQARESAKNTEDGLSRRSSALWDPEAFVAGVRDMSMVAATAQDIRAFAASDRMKISLPEARKIAPFLGAANGDWASLGGLLNAPAEPTADATR